MRLDTSSSAAGVGSGSEILRVTTTSLSSPEAGASTTPAHVSPRGRGRRSGSVQEPSRSRWKPTITRRKAATGPSASTIREQHRQQPHELLARRQHQRRAEVDGQRQFERRHPGRGAPDDQGQHDRGQANPGITEVQEQARRDEPHPQRSPLRTRSAHRVPYPLVPGGFRRGGGAGIIRRLASRGIPAGHRRDSPARPPRCAPRAAVRLRPRSPCRTRRRRQLMFHEVARPSSPGAVLRRGLLEHDVSASCRERTW